MASIVGASRQLSLLLIVAGTFDQVRGCTCPSSYPFCYDRWCYDKWRLHLDKWTVWFWHWRQLHVKLRCRQHWQQLRLRWLFG